MFRVPTFEVLPRTASHLAQERQSDITWAGTGNPQTRPADSSNRHGPYLPRRPGPRWTRRPPSPARRHLPPPPPPPRSPNPGWSRSAGPDAPDSVTWTAAAGTSQCHPGPPPGPASRRQTQCWSAQRAPQTCWRRRQDPSASRKPREEVCAPLWGAGNPGTAAPRRSFWETKRCSKAGNKDESAETCPECTAGPFALPRLPPRWSLAEGNRRTRELCTSGRALPVNPTTSSGEASWSVRGAAGGGRVGSGCRELGEAGPWCPPPF